MNEQQRKRAQEVLRNSTEIEAAEKALSLLQELTDAPEPEPVARVTGYYAGYLSIETADGRVLPAGTALYAAPPHQSEQHLEMVNAPAPSVPASSQIFNERGWLFTENGKHFWIERSSLTLATMDLENYEVLK